MVHVYFHCQDFIRGFCQGLLLEGIFATLAGLDVMCKKINTTTAAVRLLETVLYN